MKTLFQQIVNLYNTNSKFHSLVLAVEYGAASYFTESLTTGQIPTSKKAALAFGVGMVGAVVAAMKRWAATNVATQNLELKQQ